MKGGIAPRGVEADWGLDKSWFLCELGQMYMTWITVIAQTIHGPCYYVASFVNTQKYDHCLILKGNWYNST